MKNKREKLNELKEKFRLNKNTFLNCEEKVLPRIESNKLTESNKMHKVLT